MAAALLNLYVEQGATFERQLTIYEAEAIPKILTGSTLAGQIRYNVQSSDIAAEFECIIQDQTLHPGGAIIRIAAAGTQLLTQPNAYYDLELTTGTVTQRLLEGQVFISGNVTR